MFNNPYETLEKISIEVDRTAILSEMLHLYKNEQLVQKSVQVIFKGEIGVDYGGLTKELFTEFWKQCEADYFRGEQCLVPYIPLSKVRRGHGDDFIIIGRILAHTVILTKSLPLQFAMTFYLMLGDIDKKYQVLLFFSCFHS